tara:strand:+ start:1872 stop:4046 length:2175 start_codon:yes stop_codon:yes gene_type:complete
MADFSAQKVKGGWQYTDNDTGLKSAIYGSERDARADLVKKKQLKKPEPTKVVTEKNKTIEGKSSEVLGAKPGNQPPGFLERMTTPTKWWDPQDRPDLQLAPSGLGSRAQVYGTDDPMSRPVDIKQRTLAEQDAAIDKAVGYTPGKVPTQEDLDQVKMRNEAITKASVMREEAQIKREEKSDELNKRLVGLDKKTKALEKEKAGNYFIDPGSGFALNLKKMREGNKRREVMDQAALLPAASRASFLYKHGYIDKDDLPEPSALDQIKLKVAENQLANSLLKKKQLEQQGKDYMSPETKQHWDTFRSSIAAGNYELVMHMGKKIGMTDLEVEKMIEGDRKARVAAAKNSGMDKLWKNTFGENFSDYRKARDTTLKRAHERLADRANETTGDPGKRSAFLEQYNLLDWDKAEAMIGQKTTTEDGQPSTAFNDWLRNRMARDPALAYARQVMPEKLNKGNYNTFLAHAMSITDLSNSYGWEGLQQRIRAEESDRQKFDEKVLNPKSSGDTGDKPPPPEDKGDTKPTKMFKAKGAKSASQVLLQAQQAGFPDQYSGKEFIDQLNKSQGTKYSWPDNVPAEFPQFWGDKKSEIGLLERNLQEKLDKKDPKYEGAMALIDMFPEAQRDASFSVSEVPHGDSIQKILEYGSKKIPESRWNDMKKGAYVLPTLPGSYGRQPEFFREKKWDDKEGMYQYFFQNPEEMKQVPGEVRPQLIKEILEYIKTVDIKEK